MSQHWKKMGVCSTWTICNSSRVIRKVRKTQHQNPEFGHTQGEIFKIPTKKYISIWGGMNLRKPSILVVNWVSSYLSFFLSATTAATYIFTAANCTTTIISLEPCPLNAEYDHFILSCSISYWDLLKCKIYFPDTAERGFRGWKEAQTQGYFTDNCSNLMFLHPIQGIQLAKELLT